MRYTFILMLFLFSCAPNKRVINDFLISEINKDVKYKKTYIIANKLSNIETINLLRGDKLEKDDKYNGYSGYSQNDYEKLLEKYLNNTEYWKKSDFKLEDFEILDNIDSVIFNKMNGVGYCCLFYISDVIYLDKKNAFFQVVNYKNPGRPNYIHIIVLEKRKNNWVIVKKYTPSLLW